MYNNSDLVRRFIEEVLNQGRIETAGEFFRESMVEQVPLKANEIEVRGT